MKNMIEETVEASRAFEVDTKKEEARSLIKEIKATFQELAKIELKQFEGTHSQKWIDLLRLLMELIGLKPHLGLEENREIDRLVAQYHSIESARKIDPGQKLGDILKEFDKEEIQELNSKDKNITVEMIKNTIDELVDVINRPSKRGEMLNTEDLCTIVQKIRKIFDHAPLSAEDINALDNEGYRKKLETLEKFVRRFQLLQGTLGDLHIAKEAFGLKPTKPSPPLIPGNIETIK